MNYGNRISELREQRKLTQEALSITLGISRAALSHYEKNRRKPDFDTLSKLADYFQVSIDYLLGRTEAAAANENSDTANPAD
ncbi:DNA-binding XRE family transcriptional regulator [Paenibacillus sp. VMFN-D1]|uniref:Transcriptional regulator with XRE-family HTH domain n=1 Tax=Paenibacillus favisporus TaxID=221028 RepID=A0ABV2F2J1_9BACL|nr:DNA-binding XRE family transcriptional regulator [Paenibacillus sp. VMFN-D1]